MTQRDYRYAQANGYAGTFEDYCQINYQAYCAMCARCNVLAMTYKQWMTDAACGSIDCPA